MKTRTHHETSIPPDTSGAAAILLVDDQPANLLALRSILEDLGRAIVEAASGGEALARLGETEFAVVLLDVQMPGIDGFQTAKLIRERLSRQPPIIFLTAYDSDQFPADQAYALGAVDYLVKPLVPGIVKAKVAGFVDLFEKTEQVKRQAEQIRQLERAGFERQLAEEYARLKDSEARKAAIVETALDCIITIDQQGQVVEFNPAAARLFGFATADVLGRNIADLIIPPRLRDAHRRGFEHYRLTGEAPILGRRIEMPAVRSDGTELMVELAVTKISAGGPPLFTAYLRDISDRIRIERYRSVRLAVTEVLSQAANLKQAATGVLKAVCENLDWDFGAFWRLDRATAALKCFETWRRCDSGFQEFEKVTRATAFALGRGLPGTLWATGKQQWLADVVKSDNFPRAAAAGQDNLHGAFGCPIILGGETLGVVEFFSHEIREPDLDLLEMIGTIAGQMAQFIERTQAEQHLRESEQRFGRFMQNLPGLAWIKDTLGRYVYVNEAAEKAFRVERSALYGRTDDEVFPPQTAAEFKAHDQRALTSSAGVQVIETLADEHGVNRHSIVSKFPIFGSENQPVLVGGIAIDITERLQAEDALREADRRKDEFLATLAHELRNPLAPIRNALEIMKLPDLDGETIEQSRDMMDRQVHHLVRLVDDLLDVSRVMRGKIELRKERVDLATVVSRAIETAQPVIETHGHHLTVRLPDEAIALDVDPIRIAQVLSNLLANAAKYTPPRGSICLSAERAGDEALIALRDSGIGIAPDMLSKVFELFVQVERSGTRSHGGLGIGLTLAKNLVAMHDGRIEAHSAGLGQGTTFIVRLPVARDHNHQSAPTNAERPAIQSWGAGRRLLVVDDNQDAAVSLAMLLRLGGSQVEVAHDGPGALKLASSFRPEMVFLDIGMPGMDGYEVARRMRGEPGLPQPVLIAVTGWGSAEDRRRSLEAGFDHHLTKPINIEALKRLFS